MNASMKCWIYGHHLFIIFIQGIVLSLSRLQFYLQQGNLVAARKELQDAAALLDASASSMKFAADFSQTQYLDVVRPSMPSRFSGLDMVDHKELVKQMKKIKSCFLHLPVELHQAREMFNQSLAQAYDAHIYVCNQFVQDENSLRVTSSKTTAKKTLATIKKRRLYNIGVNSLKIDINASVYDTRTNQ